MSSINIFKLICYNKNWCFYINNLFLYKQLDITFENSKTVLTNTRGEHSGIHNTNYVPTGKHLRWNACQVFDLTDNYHNNFDDIKKMYEIIYILIVL